MLCRDSARTGRVATVGRTATAGLARDNASKITRILTDRAGWADLYRTVTAGPSGQRADMLVARVRYTWDGPYEVQVFTPRERNEAGYAARDSWSHPGMWVVWEDNGGDGIRLLGWASSLPLGTDVLVHGTHAATGRHDSQRVSPGTWIPYVP
jgi:hypothetical protein